MEENLMNKRPVYDPVSENITKSLDPGNLFTEREFADIVKADNLEVFTTEGLDTYRAKVFLACKNNPKQQKDIIQKAELDFQQLKVKRVILDDGGNVVNRYVRPKVDIFQKAYESHEKLMKDEKYKEKFEGKMEEWDISSIGELKKKYDEGKQKEFWKEVNSLQTSKKESDLKKAQEVVKNDLEKGGKHTGSTWEKVKRCAAQVEGADEPYAVCSWAIFSADNSNLEKAEGNREKFMTYFNEKLDKYKEEYNVGDLGDMDDETQKKFFNEVDSDWSAAEEKGNDDELDFNFDEDNNNENENENGLDDDEEEVLEFIKELAAAGDEITFEGIAKIEGFTDDETKEVLDTLKEEGLIEMDDNYNVRGLTNEGRHYSGEDNDEEEGNNFNNENESSHDDNDNENENEEENNDDENNNNNNDDEEEGMKNNKENEDEEEGNGIEGNNEEEEEGDMKENNEEEGGNNNDDEEEEGGGMENDKEGMEGNGELDNEQTETLQVQAKKTSSKELQKFIDNPQNKPEYIEIAKEELNSRNGDEGGEFNDWIDTHFDDHDSTDLQKYVMELIQESPKELKVLKEHYRNDYPKNNQGNNHVGDIDADDFGEYVKDYIAHKPFDHLKKYAKDLVNKNPDAFEKMKSRYNKLKQSNML